jgi:hypothetical protein
VLYSPSTLNFDSITQDWIGTEWNIFKMLSQVGNFTAYYEKSSDEILAPKDLGMNEVWLRHHVQMYDILLISCDAYMSVERSIFYKDINIGFIIPPSEAYSNYDKLLMPFDFDTWIYLISTFTGAFLLIFIINLMPKFFQNLVYGQNVKSPSFNVIGSFFGIGQITLPVNNFGRIVLIAFIIFCLIIRTAYQGVLFELMVKEIRRPLPQQLQELFDQNYIFVVHDDAMMTILKKFFNESNWQVNQWFSFLKLINLTLIFKG